MNPEGEPPVRASPETRRSEPKTATRPTRIIAYAWGEKYVNVLLNVALPALLAPGNLPAIVKTVACEAVVLTEERFFETFNAHPNVRAIRSLCSLRLVSLDDLVCAPDKYGISLTYVLHRGCADLGAAMTDWWLLFMNADFILADGSLRSVVARLQAGERLVAAPSYCANSREVMPLLERYHVPGSSLTIAPRDLAKLTLAHRHQTLLAKILNRSGDHFRYMDQFYWEVDEHTLLGHQMPVAIVGMRPQRAVDEPNSYWDYGLMREFCPTAAPCVMGDSDEFLMLELRDNEVARDALVAGPMNYRELGERMIIWVTPYQRDFAQYALTLHAKDLPPETEAGRVALKRAKDEILSYAPPLPSHLDHPQWNYHRYGFMTARHAYLSARLGEATVTSEPPEIYSELDKAWWRFDGMRKRAVQRRIAFIATLDAELATRCAALARAAWPKESRSQEIDPRFWTIASTRPDAAAAGPALRESGLLPLDHYRDNYPSLEAAVAALFRDYTQRVADFERQSEDAIAPLEEAYALIFPKRVDSARLAPAHLPTATEPNVAAPRTYRLRHLLKRWRRILFGELPRVTRWHPYWSSLRPLVSEVEQARLSGAKDVLFVGRGSGVIDRIADDVPGLHVATSVSELNSGVLSLSLRDGQRFDLCICDLDAEQLADAAGIHAVVRKYLRPSGAFIGFYFNRDQRSFAIPTFPRANALGNAPSIARVYYVGRVRAVRPLAVLAGPSLLARALRKMFRWTYDRARRLNALSQRVLRRLGWRGGSLGTVGSALQNLGRNIGLELRNLRAPRPHEISGNDLQALRLKGMSVTIIVKGDAPTAASQRSSTPRIGGSRERAAYLRDGTIPS